MGQNDANADTSSSPAGVQYQLVGLATGSAGGTERKTEAWDPFKLDPEFDHKR